MKFITAVVLCSILYQGAQAGPWGWFSSGSTEEPIVSAVEDVTEECLQHMEFGTCEFYSCIERRFPCGTDGYTERVSKHFCNLIDSAYNNFDANGQIWLNRTSICLMNHYGILYNAEGTTCAEIKNVGIEAVVNCNEQIVPDTNGEELNFCRFIESNGDQYNGLMGRTEIRLLASLGDRRVWTSMISQAVRCGVSRLSVTVSNLGETVTDLLTGFSRRITSLFTN